MRKRHLGFMRFRLLVMSSPDSDGRTIDVVRGPEMALACLLAVPGGHIGTQMSVDAVDVSAVGQLGTDEFPGCGSEDGQFVGGDLNAVGIGALGNMAVAMQVELAFSSLRGLSGL